MNISKEGLELIKKYEGLRLTAYKCVPTEQYYTIGYGHYGADVSAGMTITEAQAEAYLWEDIREAEQAVNALNRAFNQNQFDALVSFTYNCGAGNLKKLCKDRDLAAIGEKLILYNKSGGKKLAGLVRRRAEEQKLYQRKALNQPPQSCGTEKDAESIEGKNTSPSGITFIPGHTYTLQAEMKVRTGAGTNFRAKRCSELSADGKKHDRDKDGALDKGTKVTCKEVRMVGNDIWMRTPSGWIAAVYGGKTFIA